MLLTVEDERKPITEWAEDFGIPCSLIRSRLKRGWSEERAVTEPMIVRRGEKLPADAALDLAPEPAKPVVGRPARRYEHAGRSLTIAEWSQSLGLHELTIRRRLDKGASIEEALTTEERRGRPRAKSRQVKFGPTARHYEHAGLSLTVAEWAERAGISPQALYARLKLGWSLADALAPGDQRGGSDAKLYELNGEALTIAQWASRTGLREFTIRSRFRLGWPVERAVTEPSRDDKPKAKTEPKVKRVAKAAPPRKEVRRYTHDGVSLTLKEWALRSGLKEGTLRMRISSGWPIEEALAVETSKRRPTHERRPCGRVLSFAGKSMRVNEWADHLGIDKGVIRYRLREGWPLHMALNTHLRQGGRSPITHH